MAASNIATSNEEMLKLHAEFSKLLSDYCLMVILGGYSKRDLEYKRKVLRQIALETDGTLLIAFPTIRLLPLDAPGDGCVPRLPYGKSSAQPAALAARSEAPMSSV